MSRRDRRAALARGKAEPAANLTELAGRARLAFQEGRAIDAEVLCKQILDRGGSDFELWTRHRTIPSPTT
jgi:hypothetical protein